ncbi:MAG: hypothetical protein DYH08_04270 [Actinobacteria bacterium ATB1]|nr:hypothetical protein [Actinobacteria bacterium ATB1]
MQSRTVWPPGLRTSPASPRDRTVPAVGSSARTASPRFRAPICPLSPRQSPGRFQAGTEGAEASNDDGRPDPIARSRRLLRRVVLRAQVVDPGRVGYRPGAPRCARNALGWQASQQLHDPSGRIPSRARHPRTGLPFTGRRERPDRSPHGEPHAVGPGDPCGHSRDDRSRLGSRPRQHCREPLFVNRVGCHDATVSSDDRYAIIDVGYDTETADLSRKQVRSLESTVGRHLPYGIEAAFTGDLVSAYPPMQRDYSELIGLAAAVVILLVAFGSVTGMALPILSAGFGLVTGLAAIDLLERVVEVPAAGPVVGTMIGLGAGIDYSLFLVTRHRECLAGGAGVREAVAMASTTAGRSVLIAGTTVVAANIGLALIGIPIVTSLGYTVAVMVCIAVAVATTLLPALLSVLGPRIDALTVGPLARNAHKSLTARRRGRSGAAWQAPWQTIRGRSSQHPWPSSSHSPGRSCPYDSARWTRRPTPRNGPSTAPTRWSPKGSVRV